MHPRLHAFQQASERGGRRLYLHHQPHPGTTVRGAIVYVHPWAEEMNKSRRQAAMAARRFAAEGFAVLQVDLAGCGDSSGDFGDADWPAWIDDVLDAARWLQERHTCAPLWLWGLRTGALIAAAAAARLSSRPHLLFWQPTLQGRLQIQQFLRLKAAAQIADGSAKAAMGAARAELAAGRPIEIAGYQMGPDLARGLESARLLPPARPSLHDDSPALLWLEVSPSSEPALAPASVPVVAAWREAGYAVRTDAVAGPSFWQTTEVEDVPALIESSIQLLASVKTVLQPEATVP